MKRSDGCVKVSIHILHRKNGFAVRRTGRVRAEKILPDKASVMQWMMDHIEIVRRVYWHDKQGRIEKRVDLT